jgi:hypothetical protein
MVNLIEPQWQEALSFGKLFAIISLDKKNYTAIRPDFPRVHLYQSKYPFCDSLARSDTAHTINLLILLKFFPDDGFI